MHPSEMMDRASDPWPGAAASGQGEVVGAPHPDGPREGAGRETMRSTIFAYPTCHRGVGSALWSPPSSAAKMAGA